MRKFIVAAASMAMLLAFTGVASAQESGAQVSVVHGVPGLTVDVYVNGESTLTNFEPGDVAGPLTLPAGSYELAVTAAGDTIDNAVLTATADVTDGLNASVVAHLLEDGTPTLTVFANDTSSIGPGNGRLTARHTAAAPAVDILLADGTPVATNLSNPNEAISNVLANTYSAGIAPAGGTVDDFVVGPIDLEVPEGTNRIVYAIGDLAGGSFDLVIQDVAGLGTAPAAVPTGSGDLAGGGLSPWFVALAFAAALALGVSSRLAFARNR